MVIEAKKRTPPIIPIICSPFAKLENESKNIAKAVRPVVTSNF